MSTGPEATVQAPSPNPSIWRRLLGRPTGDDGTDRICLRRWFVLFVGWMTMLALVGRWSFAGYAAGDPGARGWWLISIVLFYLSLCCLFFPAPTAWVVMLLASNEMALCDPVWLRVVLVAALGAIATGVANLNEYHIITFLLRYGRIGQVRDTRLYRWADRWFAVSPFLVVAVFGFLPLPVDVVRWLAILARYRRWRYFAAYVVGRFPRYVIWALSAVWLDLNWRQIVIVQVLLVLAAGLAFLRSAVRRRRPRPANVAAAGEMA